MKAKKLLLVLLFIPLLIFGKSRTTSTVLPTSNDFTQNNFVLNEQWWYWIQNQGNLGHNPNTGSLGGFFTFHRVPVIYLDGFVWGGFVKDESDSLTLIYPRVGGITYREATTPGRIQDTGGQLSIDTEFGRLFKIRKNWSRISSTELRQELSLLSNTSTNEIPDFLINDLRNWYAQNWKNWPVEAGAPFNDLNQNGLYDPVLNANGFPLPEKGDYPGIAEADQVIWLVVNDLDSNKVKLSFGGVPLGLEVQITVWAYDTDFLPLTHSIFERYVLINKSSQRIDSMYVGKFVDPDLGAYYDDLVGCDSTLSLGYVYNGYYRDAEFDKFKLVPACIGFSLLQGPIVETGNPQDTALVNFSPKTGFINLPMTSFNYLAAGGTTSDPPQGTIAPTIFYYNMLRGLLPLDYTLNPPPLIFGSGPKQGQPTKFPLSGDPVHDPNAQFGDVDGRGGNMAPSDRRLMVNSGPFTMQPGEQQEIIYAVTGGWGKDNLQGIEQVKSFNQILKKIYRKGFKNANPRPPAPQVKASPFDDYVVLNWGWNEGRVKAIEQTVRLGYRFEGYNVYQLPDSNATLHDPRTVKLATFDRVNQVFVVEGLRYFPEYNRYVKVPLQTGWDSGIRYYYIVRKDSINNRPLYRGSSYYFAVTAYNYNPKETDQPSLESDYQVIKVTIQDAKPGYRYLSEPRDTIKVTASKQSDVQCQVQVVDPAELTGHTYQVYFTQEQDTTSNEYGQWLWNLKDLSTGKVLLTKQQIKIFQSTYQNKEEKEDFLIADGLLVKVLGPPPQIDAIVEVANQNGPLPEDQWDAAGAPYHGNNVWQSLSAPDDVNRFYISAGGGRGNIERIEESIVNARSHDFEMRVTESGGLFLWWDDDSNKAYVTVPFEAWDVGKATYDDPSDDMRCLTGGYSGGATVGIFDFVYQDPSYGFPATDWIDIRRPLNEQGSYQAFKQDIESGTFSYGWWPNSVEVLSNIIICDYGGAGTLPAPGTVIRFITSKTADQDLTFTFTAPGKIENDLELMKKDVEKINVFPNPYYAASSMEPDRFTHFVTFNHLPPHAIIRIFTLNGAQVIKLEKNDPSQFFRWDLKNEKGWRVASGLYIVHIDMPELKKQKILKLMVITGKEVLEYY